MAEETDYEKQYKDDLERAQALSLESLALEQFRHQRLQQKPAAAGFRAPTVLRAASMTESDASNANKMRPRPGTTPSTAAGRSLIAPPPRKNSTSFDSPDLISFANLPPVNDNKNPQLNWQIQKTIFPSENNRFGFITNTGTCNTHLSNSGFFPAQNNGNVSVSKSHSLPAQLSLAPPALPPKNVKQTPPPLAIPSSHVRKSFRKPAPSSNLIDLGTDDRNSVRVSILQEFDPILTSKESDLVDISESVSICGSSVYDEYDPYDIYTGSGGNSLSDPIYASVKVSEVVVPSTPRIVQTMVPIKGANLIDCIVKVTNENRDDDLKAFYEMVKTVRGRYRYNDPNTNLGLVISPMVQYQYRENTSIKLCVYPNFDDSIRKPFNLTCDVNTSVEHVTLQCAIDVPATKFTLKVHGCNEYLVPITFLADYEYVHNCIKLDEDVLLDLIPDSSVDKSLARTQMDDQRDRYLSIDDIVPNEEITYITYDDLLILLETIENEIGVLEQASLNLNNTTLQPQKVVQTVKCVVNLMGRLCTLDLMDAIDRLVQTCENFRNYEASQLNIPVNQLRLALENLIALYCQNYHVNFQLKRTLNRTESPKHVHTTFDEDLIIRIRAIYRPPHEWKHDSYFVVVQIYHGSKPVGHPLIGQRIVPKIEQDKLWPSRIVFDDWFELAQTISGLARESRLVLVIYGRTRENSDDTSSNAEPKYKQEVIGWTSMQFFNYEGEFRQGSVLLRICSPETNFIQGPAPPLCCHSHTEHAILDLEIPNHERISFLPVKDHVVKKCDFGSLDGQMQAQLKDITEQDMLAKLPPNLREILWEKRHYLTQVSAALPKVLLAAKSWDFDSLPDLYGLLHSWVQLAPIQALELLLPTFPDLEVRKMAVRWLKQFSSDELIDFLPQLVVALRHETYDTSPLAEFLLDNAMKAPRFAHHLFWLLSHGLIDVSAQVAPFGDDFGPNRCNRRMQTMHRALCAICGEALQQSFVTQQNLVRDLNEIAGKVKEVKESNRELVLSREMALLNQNLIECPASLPLSLTQKVNGVNVRLCSYYASNTLPVKIVFTSADGAQHAAIYKVGDDLQQDMLTLQVVRLMNKLWLNQGLDLKMVSFGCVATGHRRGIIEMVTNADTLRRIQMEHGMTGVFKDKPIAEWLQKHNPSELEYGRAVENFTASCAGYCVVTYILGICDRHNDNIMLKTSGHLFHIDFGKFLGDAQKFGNFKRDRAPFVLTADMAYVINGGERPSEKFQRFVDLCCTAFNIIRANCNLFLCLFTMMFQPGNGGPTDSVSYLHKALLPEKSNAEAAAYFARLIESSLKAWFTSVNFFLHNLGQIKFSSDNSDDSLLSFVPKTYTMESEGKLKHVQVLTFRKRYDPDKYYVYELRVHRIDQLESMTIQRTYKEFCELHQKLCTCFPLAKLHSLSTGMHVGRSNIYKVAERRIRDINSFIQSLFLCADEIAHSNLVYTFFHPILRDQQTEEEVDLKGTTRRKPSTKHESQKINGQIKLSFQYARDAFRVTVHHVRNLAKLGNGQEPSTYVKVYLMPDQRRDTKRKTKIIRKNCHPSFYEILEYRMVEEIVRGRRLRATVWSYDSLQENEFLGGVELDLGAFDLRVETVEWYPLDNLVRE